MARIAICASISMYEHILSARKELEAMGHEACVPEGVYHKDLLDRSESEKASDKIRHDFIRKHYEIIRRSDAILVVNPDKNGIKGYVGGNTFLEMGFAFVLGKRIFCLNPLPNMPYTSEIIGMQPIVLNGSIRLLDRYLALPV